MALHALKDVEHRVQLEAETMGLERGFPGIGPANVKGIEINPYAGARTGPRVRLDSATSSGCAATGSGNPRDPILKPLETIECPRCDPGAGRRANRDWPEADVVIGNPAVSRLFALSARFSAMPMSEALRHRYSGEVSAFADLVCYWFHKAGRLVAEGRPRPLRPRRHPTRSGAARNRRRARPQSLRRPQSTMHGRTNRGFVDGAAVRVSLICFARRRTLTCRSAWTALKPPRINVEP